MIVYDTSVAIMFRDGDERVLKRSSKVRPPYAITVVTQVELEGGVFRRPEHARVIRARLDSMYQVFDILPFLEDSAQEYGRIIAAVGYSRRKILDRMIAAQALVHGATLATTNPHDFDDVPGLTVEAW